MDLKKSVCVSRISAQELTTEHKELMRQAIEASKTSYAPYSQFYVGCSVLLENGDIVQGSNQENASFPSGLCAERVALFEVAKNLSQNKVKAITIMARSDQYQVPEMLVPCAACLQVISDIELRQQSEIEILMHNKDGGLFAAEGVKQFLPFHFELKS